MKYNVTVSVRDNISDKEKSDRINQFRQSFVTAATDYYALENKQTMPQKAMHAKQETA
ncbi:MAG: hypothetical protein FWF94_06145 [Oscillospiraceae bacterium]|nr:hypothetical protein [Oscillospiraceae bacterium]